MHPALIIVAVVALCAAGAIAFGSASWRKQTAAFRATMQAAQRPTAATAWDARAIETLPPPVQRYLRAVLPDEQAMITSVRFTQQGLFRMSETKDAWQPFHATQFVTIRPPGFDWDARIRMAPALDVHVHDAYVAGAGTLHAAVLGLVTVARMHGTPEMARGELIRYLAEAPWYPTAFLPGQDRTRGVANLPETFERGAVGGRVRRPGGWASFPAA